MTILNTSKINILVISFFLFLSLPAMSYEEPPFKIITQTPNYEIRLYDKRTVAEVNYGQTTHGFNALFSYISGANQNSQEIKMTVPVTQIQNNDTRVMRFFLPRAYESKNAPKPTDPKVKIKELPQGYFAVISYSGLASDSNFKQHHQILKKALDDDGITMIGEPIKASYNSPFTLPFLRRNEAMYSIQWENK